MFRDINVMGQDMHGDRCECCDEVPEKTCLVVFKGDAALGGNIVLLLCPTCIQEIYEKSKGVNRKE